LAEARARGWQPVQLVDHLPAEPPAHVGRVAGVLPVGLAAAWAGAGVEIWYLHLSVPEALRGMELDLDSLASMGPSLRRVQIADLGGC
jgi:putative CRISPR-associated protein (TIGR02620 family)